ncbi:hypothetical protein, partial [Streptomyces clavuligerus]
SPLTEPLIVDTEIAADPQSPGDVRISVRGYPVLRQEGPAGSPADDTWLRDPHMVADEGEPDGRPRNDADVLLARSTPAKELFARHPGCATVAVPLQEGVRAVRRRDGTEYTATWTGAAPWADAPLAASAVHAWLTHRETPPGTTGPVELLVDTGAGISALTVGPSAPDPAGPRPRGTKSQSAARSSAISS